MNKFNDEAYENNLHPNMKIAYDFCEKYNITDIEVFKKILTFLMVKDSY
tara:strand:+ start:485 stop:631 length:147 start_codon:yes stop_codon:yes gene_type:complete